MTVHWPDEESAALHERSGSVCLQDRLASFLYDLMRDHVPPGVVERLARRETETVSCSNGWLALYALDLAERLRSS